MDVGTDKLMNDLRTVVGDAEDLLKATATQTGEHIARIRARAEESVRGARVRMQEAGDEVQVKVRAAAREATDQVREHPWTSVGVAAGVGLILGILLARK